MRAFLPFLYLLGSRAMCRFKALAPLLFAFAGACSNPDQVPVEELDAFAERFLVSVRDDTPLHLQYLNTADANEAAVLRPLLAKPWHLRNWDGPFLRDEGIICLADGSLLHLVVQQKSHQVAGASLAHFPHSPCPPE